MIHKYSCKVQMQSTYLIILFARHIPHVQLIPGHWADPQRETARQGESIPEWNYAIRFDPIVILVNCTSKWLISHKITLKVAFVGHHLDQVIGRLEASAGKYLVREQINSAPQITKINNNFFLKLLLKDLNSCQSRCSTSRPLCWCSNTTWCRFSSRLAETPCSRGTKEIRWKNKWKDIE